ncbi:hypothetical protein [Siansivirga zeaxanthinifaciens]|uniref:Uncharacterized protein n=1 Tax=Siansivirga zeaxanthinifaciens CC-SAMT-1 TaxID=1454006 RepID=A0A0C5WIH1_9FLAO|nr:hypothetical protein [Siansivirga zeaxanthinifaciens]AJR04964.1 hypothetical protein AW14_12785 [Siansivirga zeaxanthinifaciens CC-SAMT-1]
MNLRICLVCLLFFSIILKSAAQNEFNYFGAVVLSDSLSITYKLSFTENNGKIKGYSVTDLGGDHETQSNIFGEYLKDKNELNFRETGIVYTKSPVSQQDFCFVHATVKNFNLDKSKNIKTNFVGLFSDNTQCIDGKIFLNTQESVEKRIQKVSKKISNSKMVPDSIKAKMSSLKLMDAGKLNVLRKNEVLSVFSKANTITLTVFDGGKEDGDKISVFVNGEVVLNNYEAKNEKRKIKIELKAQKTSVKIKANNEGQIAPNTVIVQIEDGVNTIKATSNLKLNETTQIDFLKNK